MEVFTYGNKLLFLVVSISGIVLVNSMPCLILKLGMGNIREVGRALLILMRIRLFLICSEISVHRQ